MDDVTEPIEHILSWYITKHKHWLHLAVIFSTSSSQMSSIFCFISETIVRTSLKDMFGLYKDDWLIWDPEEPQSGRMF